MASKVKQVLIKPDLESICNFAVFKGKDIPTALRNFATYLEQNGMHRDDCISNIEIKSHNNSFHVCSNVSTVVGDSIENYKRKTI